MKKLSVLFVFLGVLLTPSLIFGQGKKTETPTVQRVIMSDALDAVASDLAPGSRPNQVFLSVPTPQAYDLGQVQTISVLTAPQIVLGGGYNVDVMVTCVASCPAQVNLWFHGQDGKPWEVPIVRRNGEMVLTSGYNPGELAGKATWKTTISSTSLVPVVGFVSPMVMVVDGKETAKVSIQYNHMSDDGTVDAQAAAAPVLPGRNFGFQAVRSIATNQDVNTGFAVANPNEASANLVVSVRNMAGQEITHVSRTIPAFGQIALFLTELATELATGWSGGWVDVTADQDVAVVNFPLTVTKQGKLVFLTGTTFLSN